ncbi:MAG: dynamin family protein [Desulfococcaceae bacterium]
MEQSDLATTQNKNMQVYGALSTQLNEALTDTRKALTDHAGLLPEGRLQDLDNLLAEFAGRRIRIAFYGEVKAGKSTLVNAVAGQELTPTDFGPLTAIPVRITWGSENAWRVGEHRFDRVSALYEIMKTGPESSDEVVVETPSDLLRLGGQVDLIDTPGIGSQDRFDQISGEALRSLDTVVLVVRYPALFTRYTRHIVTELQNDIGKLFVIWNLDASCAELTAEERRRQADNLRTRVAGAHELHLVNGREAFRAARSGDQQGISASGLSDFMEAVRNFAASQKREVAALREAAKRGAVWLEDAQVAMEKREAALSESLKTTREWLDDAEKRANAEKSENQANFQAFEEEMNAAERQRANAAKTAASKLRGDIGAARRSWIFSADAAFLENAVRQAAETYADEIATACQAYMQSVQAAAKRFDVVVPATPRPRTLPYSGPLTEKDRIERANEGRMRMMKRMLFGSWYLSEIMELKKNGVDDDLNAQEGWAQGIAEGAGKAVRAVLDGKLAKIDRSRQEEVEEIKKRTRFEDEASELDSIQKQKPRIDKSHAAVLRINQEAREML